MPYKEYKPEKLYYSIGEVAEILGESTSLVRFWSDSFPEFVRPQRNKKGNRKFTPADVKGQQEVHSRRCGESQDHSSSGKGPEDDSGGSGGQDEGQ